MVNNYITRPVGDGPSYESRALRAASKTRPHQNGRQLSHRAAMNLSARLVAACGALIAITGCATNPGPFAFAPNSADSYSAATLPATNNTGAASTGPATQPAANQASPSTAEPNTSTSPVVRGQDYWSSNYKTPGANDHLRYPMSASTPETPSSTDTQTNNGAAVAQAPTSPSPNGGASTTSLSPTTTDPPRPYTSPGVISQPTATSQSNAPSPTNANGGTWLTSPYLSESTIANTPPINQLPGTPLPVNIRVQEARTGRFMFGAGVNSDAGVTGQIVIDERNFNIFGFPTSWDEVWNGEAFRGQGQGFRLEAVPGNQVQRYLVSFTEPYLFQSRVSLNTSGFLYDRGYYDWTESRVGGRLGLGYRLAPDLSISGSARAEGIRIKNPRVLGVAALDDVVGNNSLYSGRASLRHDTRDVPFAPTEGHLVELSYEQAFGDFDYPKFEVDYRRYFLVRERADGSGRHTISLSLSAGFSGEGTPIFENYFAGGFSTIRGFEFRGASPVDNTVVVGGRFRTLGSLEYTMPLTADDMIKAVAFCDFGTVEQEIKIQSENFRIAPGFGFRIAVPALGPAPLAFDFAFPVSQAETDETQVFSFFFGLARG